MPSKPAPKPDWLDDVAASETLGPAPGPSAGAEPPAWLEDLRLWYGLELYAAPPAAQVAPTAVQAGGVPAWLEDWLVPKKKPARAADPATQPPAIPIAQPVGAKRAGQAPLLPEPGAVPLARPVRQGPAAVDALAAKAIGETGFDPQTGRILDDAKFRRWQRSAVSRQSKLTNESLFEAFRKARIAIENWVDDDTRRPLIRKGDLTAIKQDKGLVALLKRYEGFGAPMRDRLVKHLEFMVENRRKYYLARE